MTDEFLRLAAQNIILGKQVVEQAEWHLPMIAEIFAHEALVWHHIPSPENSVSFQALCGPYQFLVAAFETGHEGGGFAGTAVFAGSFIIVLPPKLVEIGFNNARLSSVEKSFSV